MSRITSIHSCCSLCCPISSTPKESGTLLQIMTVISAVRWRCVFGLNIFYFISHEKGLGRAKMLCHSPLPHNGYTCIKMIIYTHNIHTHTHTVTEEMPCCRKSLIYNKYSMEVSYYQVNNGTHAQPILL